MTCPLAELAHGLEPLPEDEGRAEDEEDVKDVIATEDAGDRVEQEDQGDQACDDHRCIAEDLLDLHRPQRSKVSGKSMPLVQFTTRPREWAQSSGPSGLEVPNARLPTANGRPLRAGLPARIPGAMPGDAMT